MKPADRAKAIALAEDVGRTARADRARLGTGLLLSSALAFAPHPLLCATVGVVLAAFLVEWARAAESDRTATLVRPDRRLSLLPLVTAFWLASPLWAVATAGLATVLWSQADLRLARHEQGRLTGRAAGRVLPGGRARRIARSPRPAAVPVEMPLVTEE